MERGDAPVVGVQVLAQFGIEEDGAAGGIGFRAQQLDIRRLENFHRQHGAQRAVLVAADGVDDAELVFLAAAQPPGAAIHQQGAARAHVLDEGGFVRIAHTLAHVIEDHQIVLLRMELPALFFQVEAGHLPARQPASEAVGAVGEAADKEIVAGMLGLEGQLLVFAPGIFGDVAIGQHQAGFARRLRRARMQAKHKQQTHDQDGSRYTHGRLPRQWSGA